MIRFVLFGIPVGVDWWFLIFYSLLTGGLSCQSAECWTIVGVKVFVIFISILLHELGHAFVGRKYGSDPIIRLQALGGVTYLPGASFTRTQHIQVSFAGPLVSALTALFSWIAYENIGGLPPMLILALKFSTWANIIWTIINLLPIQPMDGGQILRDVLGPNRFKTTCTIGFVFAVGIGVLALIVQEYILAVMLGFMAYLNLQGRRMDGGVVTH